MYQNENMFGNFTCFKALSLCGVKTACTFPHPIFTFLFEWTYDVGPRRQKQKQEHKSGEELPESKAWKGFWKNKRPILAREFLGNPTKPTKRMESLCFFLIFLISSLQKESQFPSFFTQTRGLSASLLLAALGPMSKEQLEVLWPSGAVISPDMFFLKTAKLESEYQISINIPEGSRR